MQNQNVIELYNKFTELLKTGSEADARKFLVDNLTSFPEELQEQIIMAFFEEAIASKAAISKMQHDGIGAMKDLEKEQKDLNDRLAAQTLRASI